MDHHSREFVLVDQVKDRLLDQLAGRRNVNGGGIAKDEAGHWYIKVNLVKPPRWWQRRIPTKFMGVRVDTQVIGVPRAQ